MVKKLCLDELESRCTPTAFWSQDGIVKNYFISLEPFKGFKGPVQAVGVEKADKLGYFDLYAAAGEGGLPAVYVGDFNSPSKVFFAYEESFRGGVNIAVGDLTGDGIPDIVTGTGNGGGPRVSVFDGRTYNRFTDFFAAEESFRGGINVAIVDGHIITGTGVGGGPAVREFGIDGKLLASFYGGYADDRSGITVRGGDVAPYNGRAEIVTLTGMGKLAAFDLQGNQVSSTMLVEAGDTIGIGTFTANLVPHVILGTKTGHLIEVDINPIFKNGRVVSDAEYLGTSPMTMGEAQQLYGVDRFDRTGGFLNQRFVTSNIPLGQLFNPVPGGVAIGPLDGGTGTLTGYVQDDTGRYYGLTNHHVVTVGAGDSFVGKLISQPGPFFNEPRQDFGTVKDFTELDPDINVNDSAIIEVDQAKVDLRHAYSDTYNNVGYVQTGGLSSVKVGDTVYKFGFWGVRMGIVVAVDQSITVVDRNENKFEYQHQIIAASAEAGIDFVIPGDSGSLITDAYGNKVGQLFAGGGGIGVFAPIQTVLTSLGVH